MLRTVDVLTIVSVCAGANFLCNAQTPTFSPLAKTGVWQGGSRNIPTWSGGAFLTVDQPPISIEAKTSPDPNIFISSNQGIAVLPLRIPGAVWTQNRGIARGADGTIAVCGDAKDSNGKPWAYLAFFFPNSAQPTVVHTEPYHATAVSVAPDGSVWTKGVDVKPLATPSAGTGLFKYDRQSGNGILRHFARSGASLGSAITQSGLSPRQALWGELIASSADRVGWCQYCGFSVGAPRQGGYYFEVFADGSVNKTALPAVAEGETIDALAITDGGHVLITKSVHGTNAQLFALDRKSGTWQPAQFPAIGFEGTGYYMLGAIGNQAAFWTNGTSGFNAQLVEVR
jgi:hypothetical protein